MDDIGHSPLLKFIVADRKIPIMSEPDIKIQVCFNNSNITSTVPEEQKLRDAPPDSQFTETTGEHTTVEASDILYDFSETNARLMNDEENMTDEAHKNADLVTEVFKEDFVLTPVMTVTKEEAVLTKSDLKLQKVTVTEDISGTSITTTTEEDTLSVINNGESEIPTEVFSSQKITSETQINEKDKTEYKKPKTRIPTLKFRQAVDQLKKDRQTFEDKKQPEIIQPTPRRSSIPRLIDSRCPISNIKDSPPKIETPDPIPRLSDEFDKLYDEISEGPDSLDNLSIISKIEDPVKLDNTFEEIIHAYEENKIQPINVEKVRQSKIPLLKRKSEHEIEVPKQTSSTISRSISVDLNKSKTSGNMTESHNKIHSITLNKSPITGGLITKKLSEINSTQEFSVGHFENVKSVNNINEEIIKNTESNIVKEEISEEVLNKTPTVVNNKENITATEKTDIGEEVFLKLEHANEKIKTKNKDNQNEKTVENIQEPLTQKASKNISDTSTKTVEEGVYNENHSLTTEVLPDNKNEEDIPTLKGKVSRIIKRMDSKETEVKQFKKDLGSEAPKEKSVQSKVTMFEHPKSADVPPKAINICIHQTPDSNVESVKNKHDLNNHQPKIVEEIRKALPSRITEKYNDEDSKDDINKPKISDNNYAPTTEFDPKEKNINTQTQILSQSIELVHITIVNSDDNINSITHARSVKPVTNSKTSNQSIPTNNGHATDIEIIDVKDVDPINLQNIVESPYPKAEGYHNNKQNVSLNINGSTEERNSKTIFYETGTHWKPEQNISDDNQINTTHYDDSSTDGPIIINKPTIVSNIVKQEVKFEYTKVDDETLVKDNRKLYRNTRRDEGPLRIHLYRNNELDKKIKSSSLAELDLGDMKGRVQNMIVRMKSVDRIDVGKKEIIDIKERPRKKSVSEKIALFERKLTPLKLNKNDCQRIETKENPEKGGLSEEEYMKKIEELSLAKTKYGVLNPEKMKYLELRDGGKMPVIGLGTALLDPKLTSYIVQAAIDMGYRTIDTAFIYGNEKQVGEAINEKIKDGTVTRSELFIISKLWSTFHRQDLVQRACRASLDAMGLDYFDLYLIHNPMSLKEGGDPIPKIANVLQFSDHDYLDAWFGVEKLVREGLVKRGGVSNFNSQQIDKVVEKGKIKPVINQVECHPYLSQHRLDDFCQARNVKLSCFGVLGSKGTPQEHKSALPPAIDDPLVRVMAAGLDVSPAALLISYQLALDRGVIVKASNAAHLWDNLQALTLTPSAADVSALHALNRNKRTFTFKGLGDTHRNYPFNIPY